MNLGWIVFEASFAITVGGMLALTLALLLWSAFEDSRFPDAGPVVGVLAIIILFHGRAEQIPLVQAMILVGSVIAVLGAIEGNAWRASHPRRS